MWFDKIDPRYPLQLTAGVRCLRANKDFNNNSNLWLWGLLWNDELKGWDFLPTKKNNIEFGGRYQFPVWRGEVGLSGHNRITSRYDLPSNIDISTMPKAIPEMRAAIDGFFDIGIGLWFESTVIHADYGEALANWQSFLTIGGDYTFGIGNGLTITAEHFAVSADDKPYSDKNDMQLSGLMATYPIGLFDNISSMIFYNWDAELAYYYISWQRTYDDWTINLNTFFSSNAAVPFSLNQSISDFSSRGMQLMLIFNH